MCWACSCMSWCMPCCRLMRAMAGFTAMPRSRSGLGRDALCGAGGAPQGETGDACGRSRAAAACAAQHERGRDNRGPIDRPKKQGTRLLKAECRDEACPYNARVVATHVRLIGPPLVSAARGDGCPLAGMTQGMKASPRPSRSSWPLSLRSERLNRSLGPWCLCLCLAR